MFVNNINSGILRYLSFKSLKVNYVSKCNAFRLVGNSPRIKLIQAPSILDHVFGLNQTYKVLSKRNYT
jgi:hypothetical protein